MTPQITQERPSAKLGGIRLGPAVGALMTPAAVTAAAIGLWRLGSDLRWTGEFPIRSGLFSHWQVWLALGALLQTGASHLKRQTERTADSLPRG